MSEFDGHTPGPWSWDYDGDGAFVVHANKGEAWICDIKSWPEESDHKVKEADARLCAAAPSLLAERDKLKADLEEARRLLGGYVKNRHHLLHSVDEPFEGVLERLIDQSEAFLNHQGGPRRKGLRRND